MTLPVTRTDVIALATAGVMIALVWRYGINAWTVVIPAGLFLLLIVDGIFRPSAQWFLPVVIRGSRAKNAVALTFDDGPDPQTTPQILDLLRQHGARATFFVIGHHVEQHPALARRILAEGHEIGNHTQGHSRWFNTRLYQAMESEIRTAQETLQRITGITPRLFRPPVGLKNPQLILATTPHQLKTVLWSVHARDTLLRDPARIATRVLRRLRAGDIVDLHDGHDRPGQHRPQTVAAVAKILDALSVRGLRAVTVSELLQS